MKFVFVFLFCLLLPKIIFSQVHDDDIFITIEKQNISKGEFERIYNKNNSISSSDKQTVEEYLQMFINFKLKVQAAQDAGLDTLSSFKNELKGYRDQLAKSYLVDNSAIDSLILEAYQRMHTEVNASHIMVALKNNPTPADTLQAWNKAMAIRQQILNGEDFEKLASELSEDRSARTNKGNLGYFTAFSMVYPFESAAFNGKIGEISTPVRTRFGYHIIKTVDKQPARGEVKVAHIMLMVPQGASDSAWIVSEKRIKDIEQKLKAGANFADVAKEQSEDRGSARNGGELPAFSTGGMISDFAEAAFNLKYPGEISAPVRTFYGWHIIKLLEKKDIPPFEAIRQEIKTKISRDERAEYGSTAFISKLKNEYGFKENYNLLAELYTPAQPEITKKIKSQSGIKQTNTNEIPKTWKDINWNLTPEKASQELFTFADQSIKLSSFVHYLKNLPAPDSSDLADGVINKSYIAFVKNTLLDYENSQLEKKYSDFKNLVQEYHDGILLFNLSDSIIWSKASKDTAGLENFYKANINAYFWPQRLEATIVNCRSVETANKALKAAKKLKTSERIAKELSKAVCDSSSKETCLTLSYDKFIKGENSLIDSIKWKKGISPVITKNGISQLVVVHNLLEQSPKTLNECKGQAISDYQNALEKDWVADLRKKYSITINTEILNFLKNKYAGKN